MSFEELLKSLELSDEQIEAINSGMAENSLFLAHEQDLDVRLTKMKEQRDAARTELTEANEKVESLNGQVNDLQATNDANAETLASVDELKEQLESAKGETTKLMRTHKLEAELRKAGATDIEYAMYKLGGVDAVEVDEEGNFTNFDDKLTELKDRMPKYFETETPKEPGNGYQTIDNGLAAGGIAESDPFADKLSKYDKK